MNRLQLYFKRTGALLLAAFMCCVQVGATTFANPAMVGSPAQPYFESEDPYHMPLRQTPERPKSEMPSKAPVNNSYLKTRPPAPRPGGAAALEGPLPTMPGAPSISENIRYARHYILGPNDVVSIKFFGANELDMESLRIPPDGRITLPGTDFIMAAGLTLAELKEQIQYQMDPYLKNNTVSINLLQAKPFTIQVTGAVLSPGTYEININPSGNSPFIVAAGTKPDRATPLLSSLLLTAGGVRYDADIENIHIINDFTHEQFDINLLQLLTLNSGGDIYLSYGDRIHVDYLPQGINIDPERFAFYDSATFSPQTFPVRVYGYVREPGVIEVNPQMSNNLNSAIMQAGGYYTNYAYAPNHVVLMRPGRDGQMEVRKIDPKTEDITLMPNDMIYVPERGLGKVERFAAFLGRLVSAAATAAVGVNSYLLLFDPTRNFR